MKNDHADDFADAILKEEDVDDETQDMSSERLMRKRVRGTETTELSDYEDSDEDFEE